MILVMKTHHEQVYRDARSGVIHFDGLYKIGKRRVRIRMEYDTHYDFQSWAFGELFIGTGWQRISRVHYTNMRPFNYLSSSDINMKHVEEARDRLLDEIKFLLGPEDED